MLLNGLREFGPHKLCPQSETVSLVSAHVKAFGRSIGELGLSEERAEPRHVERARTEARNEPDPKLCDERIAASCAPELATRPVVDVEREEPVGEAAVTDAVDRVAPLAEENEVGEERLGELMLAWLEPAEQRLELRVAVPGRQEGATVLDPERCVLVDREADVGPIDLLFDQDLLRQELVHVMGGEDLVVAWLAFAEPGKVGRVWEAEEVRHGLIFSAYCLAISSSHKVLRAARDTFPAMNPKLGPVVAIGVSLCLVACTGKYIRPTTQDKIDRTPERIERGSYLVNSVTQCGVCHTPRVGGTWLGGERTDAFLAGGTTFDDRGRAMKITVPNITPDVETGIGAWTDDEIMRAVRDGVLKGGELMWPPMPFGSWDVISDDDARAIVAYLRTVSPVKNQVKREYTIPFMAKIARSFGAMHHEPAKNVKPPATGDKKALGAYLIKVGICYDCHSLGSTGPSDKMLLAGSEDPLSEPEYGKVWARNLTPDMDTGLGKFSAEQIKDALKSGKRLDGKPMAPPMSLLIPHISTWQDEDLDAVVAFVKSVPAKKHKVPDRQLTPEAKKLIGE